MKRISLVAVFCVLALSIFISGSDAQPSVRQSAHAVPSGKIAVPCPSPLNDITDCPDTGCGPSLDPLLNQQKNIRSDDGTAQVMTIQQMKALPDPVPGFQVGDDRAPLAALGEGKKITVMAKVLVVRKGGGESCNCKLTKVADTDNHMVLVDPILTNPTLAANEATSVTAEFAPRVRLDHPNLSRAKLSPLIAAANGALKVKVTGLLMFDSEHSLGGHLKRKNNWEIHPVLGMKYCPPNKTCTAGGTANWKDLEQ